jgi:hypothetical protein
MANKIKHSTYHWDGDAHDEIYAYDAVTGEIVEIYYYTDDGEKVVFFKRG